MTLTTVLRSEIETDITNWLNRADLAAFVTAFFNFAHREIQRKQDWTCMEQVWQVPFNAVGSSNAGQYPIPDNIKKPSLLYQYNTVTQRPIGFYNLTSIQTLRDRIFNDFIRAQDPTLAVQPMGDADNLIYAIWNDTINIYPTPSSLTANVVLQFDYWGWLSPPGQNSFDWFTTNTRDYLTYEALVHSAPFLVADPRLIIWKALSDKAYNSARAANVDRINAGELQMRG